MKKVAMTVVGVLTLAASANAQGTWYTDQALWLTRTTVVNTPNYNALGPGLFTSPYTELGVTATSAGGLYADPRYGALSTWDAANDPLAFTFSGNAFGGMFAMTDINVEWLTDVMTFSVDGSLTNVRTITSPATTNTYTFLGYISDSSSSISVAGTGSNNRYFMVDSFSFGNGTNPAAGGNVAPEPGTLALVLTGGCALLGLCVRRRRMSN